MDGTNIGPYFPPPYPHPWCGKSYMPGGEQLEEKKKGFNVFLWLSWKMMKFPEMYPNMVEKQILGEWRFEQQLFPKYLFNQELG